jgi:predicted N-acetyltransferase YhbS
MADPSLTVEIVSTSEELERVNAVIKSAVSGWPLADRLKRLALVSLQYDSLDLAEFEILLGLDSGCPAAVAVSSVDRVVLASDRGACVALHGLYVHMRYQAQGIGRLMYQTAGARARRRGCLGILVKAQRVSTRYFEKQGFVEITDPGIDYPFLYWKPIPRSVTNE